MFCRIFCHTNYLCTCNTFKNELLFRNFFTTKRNYLHERTLESRVSNQTHVHCRSYFRLPPRLPGESGRERSLPDSVLFDPPSRDGAAIGEKNPLVLRRGTFALRPPASNIARHPLDGWIRAVRHQGMPHLHQFRGVGRMQETVER